MNPARFFRFPQLTRNTLAPARNRLFQTVSPPPRSIMSLSPCCLKVGSFAKGNPAGSFEKLGDRNCYVTGNKQSKAAILLVADVFGCSLVNTQVLADKYAQGTGAAVYIPDYFNGEDLVKQGMLEGKQVDIPAFLGKVSSVSDPLIMEAEHGSERRKS